MIIGIPKEIKNNEYRVACTPNGVKELVAENNVVYVEQNAGAGSGFSDKEYEDAGAKLLDSEEEIFEKSEFIYKVKEILPQEYDLIKDGHIVFTYIHSNAFREQTDMLLNKNVTGIAYEDITNDRGEFPLLKPMSIIAGKGGFIAALHFMQKVHGGKGLMLAAIPGVEKPHITIIGAGNSGMGAAELASGFGCNVTVLDNNISRLEDLHGIVDKNIELLLSNKSNLENCIKKTDVLINCVLWPKWRKDHLITKDMLKLFKPGSMIVDVACDEHGAIETTHSTTHSDPVYKEEGILHYAVDNIPAAFARTASITLSNATVPKVLAISKYGVVEAMKKDHHLRRGLTSYKGKLTLEETGLKQNRPYISPEEALKL